MNSVSKKQVIMLTNKPVCISFKNKYNLENTIHGVIVSSTDNFFILKDFFSNEYVIKRTAVTGFSILKNLPSNE